MEKSLALEEELVKREVKKNETFITMIMELLLNHRMNGSGVSQANIEIGLLLYLGEASIQLINDFRQLGLSCSSNTIKDIVRKLTEITNDSIMNDLKQLAESDEKLFIMIDNYNALYFKYSINHFDL